jgi:hypothetical protein
MRYATVYAIGICYWGHPSPIFPPAEPLGIPPQQLPHRRHRDMRIGVRPIARFADRDDELGSP